MDVARFLLSNEAERDVLVTIPPASLGPFDQPEVSEQIDGYWIDRSRVPHRTWTHRTKAVRAVLAYPQGMPSISSGFPDATHEGMTGLN